MKENKRRYGNVMHAHLKIVIYVLINVKYVKLRDFEKLQINIHFIIIILFVNFY